MLSRIYLLAIYVQKVKGHFEPAIVHNLINFIIFTVLSSASQYTTPSLPGSHLSFVRKCQRWMQHEGPTTQHTRLSQTRAVSDSCALETQGDDARKVWLLLLSNLGTLFGRVDRRNNYYNNGVSTVVLQLFQL